MNTCVRKFVTMAAFFLAVSAAPAAAQCNYDISFYVDGIVGAYYADGNADFYAFGYGQDNSSCNDGSMSGCYHEYHAYLAVTRIPGSETVAWAQDGDVFSGVEVIVTPAEYRIEGAVGVYCSCFLNYVASAGSQVQMEVPPIPTGETITFLGWVGDGGMSRWYQYLQPSSVNFAGRTVKEYAGGTGADFCYFEGSARPPFTSLTGGEWQVEAAENLWGPDHLSWDANDITYYRAQGRAPCFSTIPQSMRINVPGGGYVPYLNHNLIYTIGVASVTYQRGNADPVSKSWP